MTVFLKRLAIVLVLVGAIAATLAWPHLADVETGRTPEYADLKPRDYDPAPADVTRAAKSVVERLGWTFVGAGSGPGGSEIKAVARMRLLPFPSDFTIKIKREKGTTHLTVRSQSHYGPWDFGQNARFVRAFLAEMDTEME